MTTATATATATATGTPTPATATATDAGTGTGAGAGPSAEDVVRYAFSQAPGRDFVAPLGPAGRPLTTTFGRLPDAVVTDPLWALPWGTTDRLEAAMYPQPCGVDELGDVERLHHALVAAFGLQRREPSNLFNDHRSYASVRSRFPVHAFVEAGGDAWLLEPYRHGLLPVGHTRPPAPGPAPLAVTLAGRYTHLPSLYGRLRGPLTELEVGLGVRNLCVALELFGLSGELELPGHDAPAAMARLGLDPLAEWSVPLRVSVGGASSTGVAGTPGAGGAALSADAARAARSGGTGGARAAPSRGDGDDPTLAEVVAVNRTSLACVAARPPAWSRGSAAAVPAVEGGGIDWAEVLWRRNAGRMPRHLGGVSGRRRPVRSEAVADAVAWLGLAPPTALLREAARHISVSACLQDAGGFDTGWYRLQGQETGPAELDLVRSDATLPTRLEGCYGHGLGPEVGCAVRHANAIWLLSADVPALVDALGPGGWTLAQYACGWMAHGLCLAAAAHGLYARPNRAFDEILLHPVVGMRPGEIVLLSVVSGAGRFCEPMLDMRT